MKHFQYDIVTKTGRSRLPERQEPYWHPLSEGAALGYRQKARGSWIARWRDRAGKVRFESLGRHPDFNSAQAAAAELVGRMTASSRRTPARGTVRAALAAYVRHLRSIGRRSTAWEAGQRFRLTVPRADSEDAAEVLARFGSMKLKDVTREDVEAWRNGLKAGRANRSVNRQVRSVRAALTYAVEHAGHVGNVKAWKLTPLVDDAEAKSPVFLTVEQRDRLVAAAPAALAALLTGYGHTGARPSELANAVVGDFNAEGGTVTLRHRKGRGSKLKARAVQLSDAGVMFFKEQAKGKLPKAPLLSNESAGHWTDQQWCGGISRAIEAANKSAKKPAQRIPPGASAYSFRHARISELLQVYKVDPLTVAAQTGTSITMIEKYYYSFIASSMREKLNAIKAS
jgi:integrase